MKRLKPGQTIATCRRCGAQGIEDANDPAPGICPECLELILLGQFSLFEPIPDSPFLLLAVSPSHPSPDRP